MRNLILISMLGSYGLASAANLTCPAPATLVTNKQWATLPDDFHYYPDKPPAELTGTNIAFIGAVQASDEPSGAADRYPKHRLSV